MTANNSAQDFFTTGMQEFAKNRFNESIELLTHAIEADPDHTLAIVSRGAAYLKLDMLDQARDEFNRAIGIDPGYARAYHMRGLVGEKRGDDHTALADFDRAIELNPEYGPPTTAGRPCTPRWPIRKRPRMTSRWWPIWEIETWSHS
jgi:Tfp pilus assembly protein PilF